MLQKLRLRLADNARQYWRWTSMRAMALEVALLLAWKEVPEDMKAVLPTWLVTGIAVAVLLIGMYGRVTKQKGLNDGSPP